MKIIGSIFLIATGLVSVSAQQLIPYRSGELWGYCTPDKKIVIPPKYERADWFYDGHAVVANGCSQDCYDVYDGKWGYITTSGKTRFENQLQRALPFVDGTSYIQMEGDWYQIFAKNSNLKKIAGEPDFTVRRFERHLEVLPPAGYQAEYDKASGRLKGYVSEDGTQYWDDPETVFFLPIKEISEQDGRLLVGMSGALFKSLLHSGGVNLPPSLVLIKKKNEGLEAQDLFTLEAETNQGSAEESGVVYSCADYEGIKPFLEYAVPGSPDYRLLFIFSVLMPSESLWNSTIFNIMSKGIMFTATDDEERPLLHFHTSLYELTKPETENRLIEDMVKDIRQTAAILKEQGDDQNVLIEGSGNTYSGRYLFDVMADVTEADVREFLRYAEARPFHYMGGNWKISEVFATWVYSGAPRAVPK